MTDLAFPNPPPAADTVAYYEFLLEENKLQAHLESVDPDPTGTELIKKFFEQANKPVNDQGQLLPPPENQKNVTLKSLALQAGAFLKWDLDLFDKELPMSSRHQLLREFLTFCNAATFPSRTLDIKAQITTMHDHTIMAIVLYCRWAARTVVKSAFPVKPSGRTTPTAPAPGLYQVNAQQRYEELKEQIISIVKDQCFDVVQTLETFLQQIKRAVYIPDLVTIKDKQLCAAEQSGWLVPLEELHAQVCYDLGCLHFMHGFYDKALEMFGHVHEWLKCFPEKITGYCKIDSVTLDGYLTACSSLNLSGKVPATPTLDTTFNAVARCLEDKSSPNITELSDILMRDLEKNELSMSFRDQLEQDLLHGTEDSSNINLYFDVIWLNAICRSMRGYSQPTCLWTYDLNIAQLQRILGFVQQVYGFAMRKEKRKLGGFLYSLHNNLTKESLRMELLNCHITELGMSEKETSHIKAREPQREETIVQDSPMSPDDSTAGNTDISELENRVVTSFDPDILKHTLTRIHKLAPERQNWRICDRWAVNKDYENILKSISVAISRDLMYVLLAKANHCSNDPESYTTAKRLLRYIQDNGKALSFKLQKIATNELLKVELSDLINDQNLKFSDEKECRDLREQLADTMKSAKQHLLLQSTDLVPVPKELSELCIALFLNLEDQTFFDSVSSQSSTGILRFGKILAKAHFKISSSAPPHSEAKRAANELWNTFADIFAATTVHQRRSQDNTMIIVKKSDVVVPIITRPAFLGMVLKIRNGNILKIILSALVRLHRICQEDILSDIKVPLSDLWPSSLGSGQPAISAPCLANAVREVLAHCFSIQPHNKDFLRAQADVDYAYCNYPSAFRSYLKLLGVQSNFFTKDILFSGLMSKNLVGKMVKCCMQMKCNTQAAVLCQMAKDIDYSTAFKALQESRERADAMETHYREHFWDIELLEYATCMHRDSGEIAKKESALRALACPEINVCNTPKVLKDVQSAKCQRFFRSLARQFLV